MDSRSGAHLKLCHAQSARGKPRQQTENQKCALRDCAIIVRFAQEQESA